MIRASIHIFYHIWKGLFLMLPKAMEQYKKDDPMFLHCQGAQLLMLQYMDADYKSCGILHYDTHDIFTLPLAWHSSSTSFRKPSIMFNSLIFWSVSQDGFHIYFYFQIWSLWSICFLYKPMWWWGCNKFSKNVFGFLVTLLSFELSTWRSTQFRDSEWIITASFCQGIWCFFFFFFHFLVLGFLYICVFQRDSSYHF